MKFNLEKFLKEPEYKEGRDFLSGFVDNRVKEIVAERMKQKQNESGDNTDSSDSEESGEEKGGFASFFDEIFAVKKTKS